ncbi:MAG TPA: hypothetical protein VGM44_22415 [Polyangiaceae bacterium]
MQAGQGEVCPSCGVVLPGHVRRCPSCGFLLAAAPGPVYQNSLPPRRPRPPRSVRSNLPTVIAIAGVAVAFAIAVIGFGLMRQRDNERTVLQAASIAVSAPPAPKPAPPQIALEPTTLFAKAKSAALAWHNDAALISIDITPIVDGKVDPSGKLVFTFGKPAGKKIGPGMPLAPLGFVVTANANGIQADEHATNKAVAVAEPNCIFDDVLAKAENAGVSRGDRLHLRYTMSDKNARGVWRVSRDGEAEILRTLDGSNCAIIVH